MSYRFLPHRFSCSSFRVVLIGVITLLLLTSCGSSPKEISGIANPLSETGSHQNSTSDRESSTGKVQEFSSGNISIPQSPKVQIQKIVYNSGRIDENPILINDLQYNRVFLMNKTGEILHEWPLAQDKLGNDAFLLPDGKLLASLRAPKNQIFLGGLGGIMRLLDNTGSILWNYDLSDRNKISHHDLEMLPNGNILALVWDRIGPDATEKIGYKMKVDIFPERIIEIRPEDNTIIWEWKSADHIIQDINPKLPKFGTVSKNPQKIDINYSQSASGMIMHANGLTYDAANKLIYLSVYSFSEVWVIDHSTTTEEAQGGTGGQYNRGGDLVYRFGNPSAYKGKGQRLFYSNHHPSFTSSGTFLIYSNGIGANPEQSTVYELKIPEEIAKKQSILQPPEILWSYTNPEIYFDKVGGVVRLPNGNTLITEGDGVIWEVTNEKEVVWKYSQKPGMFWRTYSYPLDSPALHGITLGQSGSNILK